METEIQPTVSYIGTLGDLGLGNKENGIPSELADASKEKVAEYGDMLIQSLREVTDEHHYSCIDGRVCMHNADGSAPEVRRRQVGGTGLLLEVALDSNAPVLSTIEQPRTLNGAINTVEQFYEKVAGIKRSAHFGGCGGVGGAIEDQKTIATDKKIMQTVEKIMSIPAIHDYTRLSYNSDMAEDVMKQAAHTAHWLEEQGWNGQKYVDGVTREEPTGVEDLDTGEEDTPHHGHKEPAVVFILNTEKYYSLSDKTMKTLGVTPPFVAHIDASFEMAKLLTREQDEISIQRAFIANLAKHIAVADRLPSDKTPVYFIET